MPLLVPPTGATREGSRQLICCDCSTFLRACWPVGSCKLHQRSHARSLLDISRVRLPFRLPLGVSTHKLTHKLTNLLQMRQDAEDSALAASAATLLRWSAALQALCSCPCCSPVGPQDGEVRHCLQHSGSQALQCRLDLAFHALPSAGPRHLMLSGGTRSAQHTYRDASAGC